MTQKEHDPFKEVDLVQDGHPHLGKKRKKIPPPELYNNRPKCVCERLHCRYKLYNAANKAKCLDSRHPGRDLNTSDSVEQLLDSGFPLCCCYIIISQLAKNEILTPEQKRRLRAARNACACKKTKA